MPRFDGLTAAREMHARVPDSRVVMFTTFGEEEYITEVLRGHAAGFILKASDPREIIAGIHAVYDGAAYLSPRVAHRLIHSFRSHSTGVQPADAGRIAELTGREREVLS